MNQDAGNQEIAPELAGEEPARGRPGLLGTSVALAVVLAVVLAVLAAAAITSRTNSVQVPDLTGRAVDPNLDVIRTILETYDLVLGDIAVEECRAFHLPHSVIEQVPGPGTRVPAGTAIAITICQ